MAKKIFFVLGAMRKCGAERVVSNLANKFSENYDIEIILLLQNVVEYDLPNNVKISFLDTSSYWNMLKPFMWLTKLRKTIRESKPEIIISFFSRINILVLISSIGLNKKIIISERNDPMKDGRSSFIRLLTQIIYPLSNKIVFQTDYAKSCFRKKIQEKSVVIHNPVLIDYDFSEGKKLKKTLVSVGRLIDQKNHKLLIDAFFDINKIFPEYTLEIYGEGMLKSSLNEQIRELKLESSVKLMGKTSNIFTKVYNADIFILSSDYEGLSNALLEAMYLETPVISTNCAGSNEIIVDKYNGLLTNVGSKSQLVEMILYLIENYSNVGYMVSNAKTTVNEMAIDKIIIKWNDIIKGI